MKKDLTGRVFNRLLVLSEDFERTDKKRRSYWICECECGENRSIRGDCLTNGNTQSCGCLALEASAQNGKNSAKHGMRHTPIYNIWCSLIQRCCNPRNTRYKNYGGRGIKVCAHWRGEHGFENFYADMGERPTKEHSVERMNNDGNYCSENCKWGTREEQAYNKQNTIWVEWKGERKTLRKWSEILKISYQTLHCRINKYKWSVDRAFTTSVRPIDHYSFNYKGKSLNSVDLAKELGIPWGTVNSKLRRGQSLTEIVEWVTGGKKCATIFITYKGEKLNLSQWAAKIGIQRTTLEKRIKVLGWSIAKALETPAQKWRDNV